MAIEATLQTALGTLVSGKCYPIINTAGTAPPYITFMKIAGSPDLDLEGPGRELMTFQIDVFATTYSAAKTLAESVKTAMLNIGLPMLYQDIYEEETRLYRVIMDYSIWS